MKIQIKALWDEVRDSKTLIFNTLAAAAVFVPALQDSLPVLQQILPPDYYGVLVKVVIGGNVALRLYTKVQVAFEKSAYR